MNQGIDIAAFKKAIITKTGANQIAWKVEEQQHQCPKNLAEVSAKMGGQEVDLLDLDLDELLSKGEMETHLGIKATADLEVGGRKFVIGILCEELVVVDGKPTYRPPSEAAQDAAARMGERPAKVVCEAASGDGTFRCIMKNEDAAEAAAAVHAWAKVQRALNEDVFGQLTCRVGPHKQDYGTNPPDQWIADEVAFLIDEGKAQVGFKSLEAGAAMFEQAEATIEWKGRKFILKCRALGDRQPQGAESPMGILLSIVKAMNASMRTATIQSEDGTFTRIIKHPNALDKIEAAIARHKAKVAAARKSELEAWLAQ